jgi:hypothetical protein
VAIVIAVRTRRTRCPACRLPAIEVALEPQTRVFRCKHCRAELRREGRRLIATNGPAELPQAKIRR